MEDLAENLSKDKVKHIHCSLLIHGASPLIMQGSKVGQVSFGFDKATLALPSHHLVLLCAQKHFLEDLLHNLTCLGQLVLSWIFPG